MATNASNHTDDNMSFSFVDVPKRDTPAIQVTTTPKHDVIGLASDVKTTHVCVNLKARDLPDDDSQRAPIDLVICLDVSGSMFGSKLQLCKKTLLLLLRVLYPNDRFGLICYADNSTIEIPVQQMTDANKKRCIEKIKGLGTRGCTNMSSAVGLAREELRQIQTPNDVQTIFFLTDGHANEGLKGEDLIDFTKKCLCNDSFTLIGTEGAEDEAHGDSSMAENTNSITMHCFGVGADHDASLLQAMSDVVAGGSYYFVENDKDVGGAFGEALGGILSVVAQSVSVTISVPEEAKAKRVSIVDVFHDKKVLRDNGSYTIVVGDTYAEECRDVVFEIKLADCSGSGKNEPLVHAEVSVSYTDTILKSPVNAKKTLCKISRPPGKDLSDPNPHVVVQWTRLEATRAMEMADQMAQRRDYEGAKNCLSRAQASVRGTLSAPTTPAEYHSSLNCLDSDLSVVSGGVSSAAAYHTGGSNTMKGVWASHSYQRSMKAAPDCEGSASAYTSKKKKWMKMRFSSP